MRAFLDSILSFIGSETLTDEEFENLPDSLLSEYTRDTYLALKSVLEGRENVSGQGKKLKSFFVAKGVDLNAPFTATPRSNIFIGSKL